MRQAVGGVLAFALAIAVIPVPPACAAAEQLGAVQGVALAAERFPGTLTARIRDVASGQVPATVPVDRQGRFAFSRLNPGTYVVELVNAGDQVLATSALVAVTAGGTAAVTITAAAGDQKAIASRAGGGTTVLAVAGAASAIGVTAMVVTRDKKIVICHKPGGQPAQTIEISTNAKDAHLAHGDTLGACPLSPSR